MFPGKNISIASSKFVSKNDCNKHKSWQYKKPQKSATDSLVRKKEEISWDERFPKIVHVGWLIRKASDIKRNREDYLGSWIVTSRFHSLNLYTRVASNHVWENIR